MKTHYPGYYKLSKDDLNELWKKATVVFDTNVLLDLYRVSDETASKLIETIAFFSNKNRVFIPFQVANEYHRNLYEVILCQKKKYEDALKFLTDFENKISEKRNHPYLPSNLKERFSSLLTDIKGSFDEQTQRIDNIITLPSIKDELATLLEGKVGKEYSSEELDKIKKEGSRRYAEKIPPGFKDADKSSDNQYGDFVIWREILDYSKDNTTDIIYVSSDVKEDWYLRLHGMTLGPRPELIKEFQDYTDQNINLYSLNQFLQEVNKQKVADIPEASLKEVESVIQTKRDTDFGSLLSSVFGEKTSQLSKGSLLDSLNYSNVLGKKTVLSDYLKDDVNPIVEPISSIAALAAKNDDMGRISVKNSILDTIKFQKNSVSLLGNLKNTPI